MARVLVVEDEPNIAEIILFKLRREGHVVGHAQSAAEALGMDQAWDMAILDSSLPGEDAIAALVVLSAHGPVAVMTESRDLDTGPAAIAAGACAVVPKPFKPTLLARLVAETTAAPEGDPSHSHPGPATALMAPMGDPR